MTAIERYYGMAAFPKLHAVDCLHRDSICGTFRIDGRRKLRLHQATIIVIFIAADQLGQRAAIGFIYVAKRVIQIRDLIRHLENSFV